MIEPDILDQLMWRTLTDAQLVEKLAESVSCTIIQKLVQARLHPPRSSWLYDPLTGLPNKPDAKPPRFTGKDGYMKTYIAEVMDMYGLSIRHKIIERAVARYEKKVRSKQLREWRAGR